MLRFIQPEQPQNNRNCKSPFLRRPLETNAAEHRVILHNKKSPSFFNNGKIRISLKGR